jgi:hypothetical protein
VAGPLSGCGIVQYADLNLPDRPPRIYFLCCLVVMRPLVSFITLTYVTKNRPQPHLYLVYTAIELLRRKELESWVSYGHSNRVRMHTCLASSSVTSDRSDTALSINPIFERRMSHHNSCLSPPSFSFNIFSFSGWTNSL